MIKSFKQLTNEADEKLLRQIKDANDRRNAQYPTIKLKNRIYKGRDVDDSHIQLYHRYAALKKAKQKDLKFGHKRQDGKHVWYEAWGNIFSRNKESGHLVTGGQGGGGSSPYMRYGSGGGRVRLSQGSTSSGKQKLTTSLIQKLGGGNFMRTRQSFVFGGSSLKKTGLFKTPKFK